MKFKIKTSKKKKISRKNLFVFDFSRQSLQTTELLVIGFCLFHKNQEPCQTRFRNAMYYSPEFLDIYLKIILRYPLAHSTIIP